MASLFPESVKQDCIGNFQGEEFDIGAASHISSLKVGLLPEFGPVMVQHDGNGMWSQHQTVHCTKCGAVNERVNLNRIPIPPNTVLIESFLKLAPAASTVSFSSTFCIQFDPLMTK